MFPNHRFIRKEKIIPQYSLGVSALPATTSVMRAVLDWLKEQRLHKYWPAFSRMSYATVIGLTEDNIDHALKCIGANSLALTHGARGRILRCAERLRARPSRLNSIDDKTPLEDVCQILSEVLESPLSSAEEPDGMSLIRLLRHKVTLVVMVHGPRIVQFAGFEDILISYANREEIPIDDRKFARKLVENSGWNFFETPPTSGSDSPRSQPDSQPKTVSTSMCSDVPTTPWFPSPPSEAARFQRCEREASANRGLKKEIRGNTEKASPKSVPPIRPAGSSRQAATSPNCVFVPARTKLDPYPLSGAASIAASVAAASPQAASSVWNGRAPSHTPRLLGPSQTIKLERECAPSSSASWSAVSSFVDSQELLEENASGGFYINGDSEPSQSKPLQQRRSVFVPSVPALTPSRVTPSVTSSRPTPPFLVTMSALITTLPTPSSWNTLSSVSSPRPRPSSWVTMTSVFTSPSTPSSMFTPPSTPPSMFTPPSTPPSVFTPPSTPSSVYTVQAVTSPPPTPSSCATMSSVTSPRPTPSSWVPIPTLTAHLPERSPWFRTPSPWSSALPFYPPALQTVETLWPEEPLPWMFAAEGYYRIPSNYACTHAACLHTDLARQGNTHVRSVDENTRGTSAVGSRAFRQEPPERYPQQSPGPSSIQQDLTWPEGPEATRAYTYLNASYDGNQPISLDFDAIWGGGENQRRQSVEELESHLARTTLTRRKEMKWDWKN